MACSVASAQGAQASLERFVVGHRSKQLEPDSKGHCRGWRGQRQLGRALQADASLSPEEPVKGAGGAAIRADETGREEVAKERGAGVGHQRWPTFMQPKEHDVDTRPGDEVGALEAVDDLRFEPWLPQQGKER